MATKQSIYEMTMAEFGITAPPPLDDMRASESILFNRFYDSALESLLAVKNWTWTRIEEPAAEDGREELETGRWKYRFAEPAGIIRLKGVFGSESDRGAGMPYSYHDKYIYANQPDIYLAYVVGGCEEKMPGYFVDALAATMARRLCIPLTRDMQHLNALVLNEDVVIRAARAADLARQPQTTINTSAFISGR
jgi:hypothetical protein